jgi:hypothetical protein
MQKKQAVTTAAPPPASLRLEKIGQQENGVWFALGLFFLLFVFSN